MHIDRVRSRTQQHLQTLAIVVMIFVSGAVIVPQSTLHADTPTLTPVSALKLKLVPYLSGIDAPTTITHAGDGSQRLFIVQKGGQILIARDGKLNSAPFLDIAPLVNADSQERGLLGLAFHPQYTKNGLFYVYYTARNGDITIARYKVSDKADVAAPDSAKILLTQKHPRVNHNGGQLAFGPDGYLYFGFGDGGGGGDPDRNGQNPKALLGKLLRIDVDSGDPYGIPDDNPYKSNGQGRPEVWDIGLRNPWRFSFDRLTGDLYIGDVGQDAYEEVDVQRKGTSGAVNYGWNVTEGLHCYPYSASCQTSKYVLPVVEYDHSFGCSITGGYVYRGKQYPRLQGTYFFADYCSARVWALQAVGDSSANQWQKTQLLDNSSGMNISTFGEDENGELYVADYKNSAIYRLTDAG